MLHNPYLEAVIITLIWLDVICLLMEWTLTTSSYNFADHYHPENGYDSQGERTRINLLHYTEYSGIPEYAVMRGQNQVPCFSKAFADLGHEMVVLEAAAGNGTAAHRLR